MHDNIDNLELKVFNKLHSPSFKPWMRVIAFIVLFCFVYQDIASASNPAYYSASKGYFSPLPSKPKGILSSLFSLNKLYAEMYDLSSDSNYSSSSSSSNSSSSDYQYNSNYYGYNNYNYQNYYNYVTTTYSANYSPANNYGYNTYSPATSSGNSSNYNITPTATPYAGSSVQQYNTPGPGSYDNYVKNGGVTNDGQAFGPVSQNWYESNVSRPASNYYSNPNSGVYVNQPSASTPTSQPAAASSNYTGANYSSNTSAVSNQYPTSVGNTDSQSSSTWGAVKSTLSVVFPTTSAVVSTVDRATGGAISKAADTAVGYISSSYSPSPSTNNYSQPVASAQVSQTVSGPGIYVNQAPAVSSASQAQTAPKNYSNTNYSAPVTAASGQSQSFSNNTPGPGSYDNYVKNGGVTNDGRAFGPVSQNWYESNVSRPASSSPSGVYVNQPSASSPAASQPQATAANASSNRFESSSNSKFQAIKETADGIFPSHLVTDRTEARGIARSIHSAVGNMSENMGKSAASSGVAYPSATSGTTTYMDRSSNTVANSTSTPTITTQTTAASAVPAPSTEAQASSRWDDKGQLWKDVFGTIATGLKSSGGAVGVVLGTGLDYINGSALNNREAAAKQARGEELSWAERPWFSSEDGLSVLNPGANFGSTALGVATNDWMHEKFFKDSKAQQDYAAFQTTLSGIADPKARAQYISDNQNWLARVGVISVWDEKQGKEVIVGKAKEGDAVVAFEKSYLKDSFVGLPTSYSEKSFGTLSNWNDSAATAVAWRNHIQNNPISYVQQSYINNEGVQTSRAEVKDPQNVFLDRTFHFGGAIGQDTVPTNNHLAMILLGQPGTYNLAPGELPYIGPEVKPNSVSGTVQTSLIALKNGSYIYAPLQGLHSARGAIESGGQNTIIDQARITHTLQGAQALEILGQGVSLEALPGMGPISAGGNQGASSIPQLYFSKANYTLSPTNDINTGRLEGQLSWVLPNVDLAKVVSQDNYVHQGIVSNNFGVGAIARFSQNVSPANSIHMYGEHNSFWGAGMQIGVNGPLAIEGADPLFFRTTKLQDLSPLGVKTNLEAIQQDNLGAGKLPGLTYSTTFGKPWELNQNFTPETQALKVVQVINNRTLAFNAQTFDFSKIGINSGTTAIFSSESVTSGGVGGINNPFSGGNFSTAQLANSTYISTALTDKSHFASIPLQITGPQQLNQDALSFSPMFHNANHQFVGAQNNFANTGFNTVDMNKFVAAVAFDGNRNIASEVIAAARPEQIGGNNSKLQSLAGSHVALNMEGWAIQKLSTPGVVSGWNNIYTDSVSLIQNPVTGKIVENRVLLNGVNFWGVATDSGIQFIDNSFKVDSAFRLATPFDKVNQPVVQLNITKQGIADSGKTPFIQFSGDNPLVLNRAFAPEFQTNSNIDSLGNAINIGPRTLTLHKEGEFVFADGIQQTNLLFSSLSSSPSLSGDFRNATVVSKISGDTALSVQVDRNSKLLASGGLTFINNETIHFNSLGQPTELHAGYIQPIDGNRFAIAFRDAANQQAIGEFANAIRWDKQGAVSGDINKVFESARFMTEAGKWRDVVGLERMGNSISVTLSEGKQPLFRQSIQSELLKPPAATNEEFFNQVKTGYYQPLDNLATARPMQALTLGADGLLSGKASNFISGFNYNFSGSIAQDVRNYAITSQGFKGDLGFTRQVSAGKSLADGGLTIQDKETIIFNNVGQLITAHNGYLTPLDNNRFTVTFRDPVGQKAVGEFANAIRWDKLGNIQGNIKQIFDNARFMTEPGQWRNVIGLERLGNSISITLSEGKQPLFVQASQYQGSQNKEAGVDKQIARNIPFTTRALTTITLGADGLLSGKASNFISGFNYNFSGSIAQDLRNYAITNNGFTGDKVFKVVTNPKYNNEHIANYHLQFSKVNVIKFDAIGNTAQQNIRFEDVLTPRQLQEQIAQVRVEYAQKVREMGYSTERLPQEIRGLERRLADLNQRWSRELNLNGDLAGQPWYRGILHNRDDSIREEQLRVANQLRVLYQAQAVLNFDDPVKFLEQREQIIAKADQPSMGIPGAIYTDGLKVDALQRLANKVPVLQVAETQVQLQRMERNLNIIANQLMSPQYADRAINELGMTRAQLRDEYKRVAAQYNEQKEKVSTTIAGLMANPEIQRNPFMSDVLQNMNNWIGTTPDYRVTDIPIFHAAVPEHLRHPIRQTGGAVAGVVGDGLSWVVHDFAGNTLSTPVHAIMWGVDSAIGAIFDSDSWRRSAGAHEAFMWLYAANSVAGDLNELFTWDRTTTNAWALNAMRASDDLRIKNTNNSADWRDWEFEIRDEKGRPYAFMGNDWKFGIGFSLSKEHAKKEWREGNRWSSGLEYGLMSAGQVGKVALELYATRKVTGINLGRTTVAVAGVTRLAADELKYYQTAGYDARGNLVTPGQYLTPTESTVLSVSFALPAAGAKIAGYLGSATGLANTAATTTSWWSRVGAGALAIPQNPVTRGLATANLALGHVGTAATEGRIMHLGESLFNVGTTYAFTGAFNGLGQVTRSFIQYGRDIPLIGNTFKYIGPALSPTRGWSWITYPTIGAIAAPHFLDGGYSRPMNYVDGALGGLAIRSIIGVGNWAIPKSTSAVVASQEKIPTFITRTKDLVQRVAEPVRPFFNINNSPIATRFISITGLNQPLNFLAGSTALAKTELNYSGNSSVISKPLHEIIGPVSGITGIFMNPGRNIVSAAGNIAEKWFGINNNLPEISAIRSNTERVKFDKFMNDYAPIAAFPTSMLVSATDTFTQAASGSYTALGLSRPIETFKEVLSLASIKKQLEQLGNQLNDPNRMAGPAQWGRLVGGVMGATAGFKYLGDNIRSTTVAPISISREKVMFNGSPTRIAYFEGGTMPYSTLSNLQRVGYFTAQAHQGAASFMKWNTGLGFIMPTLGSDDQFKAISQSAYTTAYSLDTFATSSIGLSTMFNAIGAGYGKISDSAFIRGLEQTRPVQFAIHHPLTLVGAGSGMYYIGKSVDNFTDNDIANIAGNYIANAGLAIAGIGGLSFAHRMRTSISEAGWINKVSEFTSTAKFKTFYTTGTGLAGVGIGALRGDINNGWDALSYFGTGALVGYGLRKLPTITPLAIDVASTGAITYGATKAVFDPGISAIEKWLDPRNHFDWREASTPHLFDKHPVMGYRMETNDEGKLQRAVVNGQY
ncbi:MAG: hypothetical protein KBB01_00450, partial [Candidatus Omnitrophica bacterium]|nr:hypothetical protein [Candidatus Omnitrophota bacterium]